MSALPALAENDAAAARAGARILSFPGSARRKAGCPTVPHALPALSDEERAELDRLRWFALRSRLAGKPDLERACFLLAGEANVSLDRYAAAFFHGLAQRAHRRMVFFRPGTRTVSDDEMWVIRLLAAHRGGRPAVAGALVKWRVRPDGHRWLRFLSEHLAEALGQSA